MWRTVGRTLPNVLLMAADAHQELEEDWQRSGWVARGVRAVWKHREEQVQLTQCSRRSRGVTRRQLLRSAVRR